MTDETGDDIERILAAAVPRNAPVHLRAAVLAGVAAELSAPLGHKRQWQSWVPRAVAATLLFSTAIFVTSSWWEARRMAAWDARPLIRSDVAELTAVVASVSGEETVRGVERYLSTTLQTPAGSIVRTMRHEVREIERWAGVEPLSERNQSHEETQDRI